MTRVIAVVSAKGGVGKSSICRGLSKALSEKGQSVLLVDTDIALRSLDTLLFADETAVFDWGDVLNKNCNASKALIHINSRLSLLRAPALGHFDTSLFGNMIADISKSFDITILDAGAGLEGSFSLCVTAANEALVVSTADDVSMRAASIAAQRARDKGIKNLRLIINRYPKKRLRRRSIDNVIDTTKVRLIGVVPEDKEILLAHNGIHISENSPATAAYNRIADRLLNKDVRLYIK
ncbi:MAG TPA: P-loop NTPase [Clostridia bacterium]|nr:P-loop NTPase [Clostridia bacterium]